MSMNPSVIIDLSNLRIAEGMQKCRAAIKDGLMEYGETVLKEESKSLCPVDQKKNRDTIEFVLLEDSGSQVEAQLQTESGYGGYLEIGTGLHGPQKHRVVPKNKKCLSWIDPETGERIFAKSTQGMHARPYMYPAFLKTKHRIHGFVSNVIARMK